MNYRSGSPGDGNCFNSAPPSPVSQSLSPASSPGLAPSPASPFTDQSSHLNGQLSASGSGNLSSNFPHNATNFLQQFEQITMMDTHSEQQQHHHNYGNYNKTNQFGQANMDLSLDTYYGQTSQLLFGTCGGTQQTAPQTPQTPSSIPDIVLQDFSSSTPEELARQGLSKDLSSAMGSSFDGVDFFPTDDALRDGLGPIDFNDLQMLASETSVVMDPSTEDHFRLDRL